MMRGVHSCETLTGVIPQWVHAPQSRSGIHVHVHAVSTYTTIVVVLSDNYTVSGSEPNPSVGNRGHSCWTTKKPPGRLITNSVACCSCNLGFHRKKYDGQKNDYIFSSYIITDGIQLPWVEKDIAAVNWSAILNVAEWISQFLGATLKNYRIWPSHEHKIG